MDPEQKQEAFIVYNDVKSGATVGAMRGALDSDDEADTEVEQHLAELLDTYTRLDLDPTAPALLDEAVDEADRELAPPRRADRLYRSSPWLVVYGSGLESEDAAAQVREQCTGRGVETVLQPIDEIQQVRRLDRFSGLVVVLPSPQRPDLSAALGSFARLILDYRARRPEGLESILNDSCEWFNAGVVQVVGRRETIGHSGMSTVLDRVCTQHCTDDSGLLDVFQPYTRRVVLARQPDGQPAGKMRDENIERLWRDVQAWGVNDIRDVPKLRKCIDNLRDHYESKRFSQLYRPIANVTRNRLDIILDGPHNEVNGTRKTWMENGARVCREVEKELKKIVPELTRPGGSNNKKDAQGQLRRLYRDLRIIESAERGSSQLVDTTAVSDLRKPGRR